MGLPNISKIPFNDKPVYVQFRCGVRRKDISEFKNEVSISINVLLDSLLFLREKVWKVKYCLHFILYLSLVKEVRQSINLCTLTLTHQVLVNLLAHLQKPSQIYFFFLKGGAVHIVTRRIYIYTVMVYIYLCCIHCYIIPKL